MVDGMIECSHLDADVQSVGRIGVCKKRLRGKSQHSWNWAGERLKPLKSEGSTGKK